MPWKSKSGLATCSTRASEPSPCVSSTNVFNLPSITSSSYAVILGGSSTAAVRSSGAGGGGGGAGGAGACANELEEGSDTALPLLRDCSSARSSSREVAASSL